MAASEQKTSDGCILIAYSCLENNIATNMFQI